MTALPGGGAFPPAAPEPLRPPFEAGDPLDADGAEPVEALLFSSLTCCANGSLLAKRLKDASVPSCTEDVPDDASEVSVPVDGAAVALPPASVGAASVGVAPVGVVVAEAWCTCGGADGCSCFIRRGTWNASRPTKTTPRTPAMIFCFRCFALSGSTAFFAIT